MINLWMGLLNERSSVDVAGEVENAGINRSPSAYLMNPPEERARYPTNVDTDMSLVKVVEGGSGVSLGAFSWFPTHGTSMSRDNKLISGDNKGAAARFFEDWVAAASNRSTRATSSNKSGQLEKFFFFFFFFFFLIKKTYQ